MEAHQESADEPLAPLWAVVDSAAHLGARSTDAGARLFGHVPHLAPEAYLHALFAPIGDSEIDALEEAVRRRLPTSYRRLLRSANGLWLFAGSLSVYGLRSSYARAGDAAWQPFSAVEPNTVERPPGIPEDAVVVGTYRKDGSQVYLRADGAVVRCGREDGATLNEWPELFAMLAEEARRMASCFDAAGRRADGGRGSAPPPAPDRPGRAAAI